MATRNIVPRATGEGQIGTSAKTWSAGYFDDIAVTNGVSASTFTGDLVGDVTGDVTGNVTGDVTGNVTGDVTGNVTGTASGNLPLSGGTMTGAIVGNPLTLTANDGNGNIASFVGNANGTASWNGFDVTPQRSSNQGTVSDVNVPNNSTKNLMSVTLTKGTWFFQAIAGFTGNSNGYRRLGISTNTTSVHADRFKVVDAPATSSTTTHLSLTTIIPVTSTTTFYINVYQNSGSTLATSGGYVIFKLSDNV